MSTESRRIRVLLADDHSVTREGLKVDSGGVSRSSRWWAMARDGVEAVKAASELSPDLIVMDVMMPKKDGVEACREIMDSLPDTRVIMLTASTEAERRDRGGGRRCGQLPSEGGRIWTMSLAMMKDAATGEGRLPTPVVRRAVERIRSSDEIEDGRST